MDSETTVPISAAPSKENGIVEDEYETASESEDSKDISAMPIDKVENPIRVLSENPNLEVNSEETRQETAVLDGQDEEKEISGGGSEEKASLVIKMDEIEKKDDGLGGDGGPEDSKALEVEPETVGVEENGFPFGQDLKKDWIDEVESPVVEGPIEVKENEVLFVQDEKKDEVLGGGDESEAEAGNPVLEEEAKFDTVEREAEVEPVKMEAISEDEDAFDRNLEVVSDAVEAQDQFGAADGVDSSQSLDGLVEPKAAQEEPNTIEVKEVEATDVLESNQGAPDVFESNQSIDGETESKIVETEPAAVETESEKIGAAAEAETNRSLDLDTGEEKVVFNSDYVLTDSEAKPSNGGGDSNPIQVVEPPPTLAEDCTSKDTIAEDSTSKETETEGLENSGGMENGSAHKVFVESELLVLVSDQIVEPVGSQIGDDDENPTVYEADGEEDGTVSDQHPRVAILDSSETAKQIIKEMEEGSSSASFESSRDFPNQIDGQVVSDSDEEVDTDDEGDGKELFDSAALAALLKAASGAASDGNITITSQDGTRVFSVDRPAGLGSSAPSLRPAPTRSTRPTLFSPSELAVTGEPENEMDEEERKLYEKVEDIRVKFLRLVMRLGHTPEDTVAAQVLYRLSLAEGIRRGRQMSRAFSIEAAKKKASQLEAEGEEDLKFSCNILVLGKTGVGKSATINSIFGEEKSHTNAFQLATTSVREISGVVDGVNIRVIDTPGLRSSVMDQATNRRILSSIKKYTKKCPPDIVLYVDRLDTQTRDFNDLPLLRSITSALGSSVWFNAIVALTHASSAPPEGTNGSPLSYEVFIAQRSHVVQHSIRQAAGDMRLMNPVALVENHPSCRKNREGQKVLPNGLSWRPQMLLLCYSSKILSEANSLLKLQDPSPGKLFGFRLRSPPLPYLLSTLLQSRPHPKLSSDQGGDNGDSDVDLDDFSDAEEEEEDEYDQLPPFKPLKKSQIAKLTKEQKRAYFDEYDYRVKLLQKKQWKEELRRLREMKKRGKSGRDDSAYGDVGEDFDQDSAPAAVPVPLPDMVLPPSFDCDIPTYRYRFLEPNSQLLTRPVLDTHGWDHDCGYDGVSLEETLAIANRFPAAVAVQITKDKKEFNIHLDSSVSARHGENGSSLAGFDIQSVGKQLAYILRSETKFKNLKENKTAAGISVTFLGETVATGLKVEDQLSIGKRVSLVASTGAVRAQGDVAYGANLEARLREKDYPIGQALSTLGLSLMKWRGDLALGANLQSQVNIGRNSKVAVRVGLNNKLSGQITVRTSTSEQLHLALVGILPVAVSIFRGIWSGESDLVH